MNLLYLPRTCAITTTCLTALAASALHASVINNPADTDFTMIGNRFGVGLGDAFGGTFRADAPVLQSF